MLHFNEVISKLEKYCIDAIVITGDLSDDGSQWSYDYLDNAFSKLGLPTYCCMGNHDSFENFSQMKFIQQTNCFYIGGWRFILLNSVIKDKEEPSKNKSTGFLDDDSLDYLA